MMLVPTLGQAVIYLAARCDKLLRFFAHAESQSLFSLNTLVCGVLANILGDFHRAKMRAAHRAKMGQLCALGRQRFVVKLLCLFRVEAEVELILPAKLKPSLA